MKRIIGSLTLFLVFTLFPLSGVYSYEHFSIEGWDFALRIPKSGVVVSSRIMVLFGGRNWTADRALTNFGFEQLAERYNLILLSPGYIDNNYWEPQVWSGRVLLKAITEVEKRFNLEPKKMLFYGYSAGGQCVAHFYQWMPERVSLWALHGCGYYPNVLHSTKAPGLITCGIEDDGRFEISRNFVYKYRLNGGQVLWKILLGGHELSEQAKQLAYAWFEAFLEGRFDSDDIKYGEDDMLTVAPLNHIEQEFRNPLPSEKIQNLWQKKID